MILGNTCAAVHAAQIRGKSYNAEIISEAPENDLVILQLKHFTHMDTYREMRDEITEASNGRIFLVPCTIQALEGLKTSRWVPTYGKYTCIVCQYESNQKTNYCPGCGARMEETK